MAVFGSLGAAPPAHASNYGVELNGTWRVMSNGDWARTNQVFMIEKTIDRDLDHLLELCQPHRMHGHGEKRPGLDRADQLVKVYWILDRDIPNWAPCPDGTSPPATRSSSSGGSTRP